MREKIRTRENKITRTHHLGRTWKNTTLITRSHIKINYIEHALWVFGVAEGSKLSSSSKSSAKSCSVSSNTGDNGGWLQLAPETEINCGASGGDITTIGAAGVLVAVCSGVGGNSSASSLSSHVPRCRCRDNNTSSVVSSDNSCCAADFAGCLVNMKKNKKPRKKKN